MPDSITRRFCLRSMVAVPAGTSLAGAQIARVPGGYTAPRRVQIGELTRREFREAQDGGTLKAVIVPTGSTEQHNEHLAMIHDTASAALVAELAALRLYPQVFVTPPVSVGVSGHWMDRKGTLTLKPETFNAVVGEICESLKVHGVKKIFVLNGHGGNEEPLAGAVPGFRKKLGIDIALASYWDAYSPAIIKKYMESNEAPGHAAEFETSVAMAAFPQRIHWEGVDYAKAKEVLNLEDPEDVAQDEHFARTAKLASTAKGEAMIEIAVAWTAQRLRELIG